MRLRTLPLSEAGVLTGMFLAMERGRVGLLTALFLVLTTALLQILSNLSNELGDTLHGTDSDDRQGIHYSLQDGEMTVDQMRKLIATVACACGLSGFLMIMFSFGTILAPAPAALILLGAAAIWAAMHYTLGDNPYGYRGLGDIFVFIFFGIVSVFGGYFVCSHDLSNLGVLIPASAIGCFSVAVLNVNNIRDMQSDVRTRTTVALKLGPRGARIYQTVLIAAGWILLITYSAITAERFTEWLFLMTVPMFIFHLKGVWTRSGKALDPMLPILVMSTFVVALVFGIERILP